MPFELFNAPVAFQALTNKVIFGHLETSVVVYLNDILIFSPNLDLHHFHVQEVLTRLWANSLLFKMEKYDF